MQKIGDTGKYHICPYIKPNSDAFKARLLGFIIAPPIKPCQKDEGRKEIYQGRKTQDAEF
jgi:hypothetical protein